ncbi:MAG: hypothetical protein ACRBCK_03135 [Alphaproteobacteria bacterium]
MPDNKLKEQFASIYSNPMIKKDSGEIGISFPAEFVKYGAYSGAEGPEFYCSIHSVNEDISTLTDKQLADLEHNRIDIDSLPVDDFNFERVMKFDFDKGQNGAWIKHSDISILSDQDFCYYSDFNEFATDMMEAHQRYHAPSEEEPEGP